MQIKSVVAVAAFALTVKADQEIAVGKGGALDFSKSGGVAVGARGVAEANQGAHGPVAMGGAMDFSKSSNKQNKRWGPGRPDTTCTEDIPWIPEWTPGASVVGEGPEPEPTTTAAVLPTTSSVINKNQVGETSSPSALVTVPIVSSIAAPSLPVVSSVPAVATSSLIAAISSSSQASVPVIASLSSSPIAISSHLSYSSAVISDVISSSVSSVRFTSPSIAISSPVAPTPIIPSSSAVPKVQGTSTHAATTSPAGTVATSKTGAGLVTTSSSAPVGAITSAPAIVGSGTHGAVTFKIVNSMGGSITISYQLGTYSPATGGPTTVASSLIGPSATTGVFATETTVVAPVGWAGRMTIGKAGALLDYRGTKIEGNNGFDGADPNADPDPDVDVSYVDGYSVPASCSCGDVVLSGCNKELFDLGNKCDNLAGDSAHPVCVNDPRNIHGPANAFFAPCAAAAYTYDYNDDANWQGSCPGNTITCCIGTNCPAPTRQPKAKNKREMMALMGARKRAEAAIAA